MKGKLLKVLGVTLLAAALFVAGTKEVKADEEYEIGHFNNDADYVVKYESGSFGAIKGTLSEGADVTGKTLIVQNASDGRISMNDTSISARKEVIFMLDGILEKNDYRIYRGTEGTKIKFELEHKHSGSYKINDEGEHQLKCYYCNNFYGDVHSIIKVKDPNYIGQFCDYYKCKECGERVESVNHNYTWVTEVCSDTGRTYKVKKCKNCNKYDWSTQTFIEEKKEEIEEKEEKKEESSSSSSSKVSVPVLSAAEQAKVTEQAQAVVGSKAYTEKQAEIQKSVVSAVAALTKLTPAQVSAVQSTGVAVNLGGCTTLDRATVVTLASNSTIPYNMAFTWNGLAFSVKVPAGADYLSLLDANGNLQMWKLVQKYGIATVKVVK